MQDNLTTESTESTEKTGARMRFEGPVTTTASGREIDWFNIHPWMFTVHDLALGHAHESRFGNQTLQMYTLAEHVINVSRLLGPEKPLRLAGLVHDAAEALGMKDMPAPIKQYLYFRAPYEAGRQEFTTESTEGTEKSGRGVIVDGLWMRYEVVERAVLGAVSLRVGLAWPWPEEWWEAIHHADVDARRVEQRWREAGARYLRGALSREDWVELCSQIGPRLTAATAAGAWLREFERCGGWEVEI